MLSSSTGPRCIFDCIHAIKVYTRRIYCAINKYNLHSQVIQMKTLLLSNSGRTSIVGGCDNPPPK